MSDYTPVDFASEATSELTAMSIAELKAGLKCGQLDIGQINTLFTLAFAEIEKVAGLDDFLTGASFVPTPGDAGKGKLILDMNEAGETIDLEVELRNGIARINGQLPDAAGNFDLCAKTTARTPDGVTKRFLFCDKDGMGKAPAGAVVSTVNGQLPDAAGNFDLCAKTPSPSAADVDQSQRNLLYCGPDGVRKGPLLTDNTINDGPVLHVANLLQVEQGGTPPTPGDGVVRPDERPYAYINSTGIAPELMLLSDAENRYISTAEIIGPTINSYLGLIRNGSGAVLSNANFSRYEFRADVAPPNGVGYFRKEETALTASGRALALIEHDDFLVVDAQNTYTASYDARWSGATRTTAPNTRLAFQAYDRDRNVIRPSSTITLPGSETFLAAPYTTGDATMQLVSTAGWQVAGGTYATRCLAIGGYADSFGFVYGDYGYSRWTAVGLTPGGAPSGTPASELGAWEENGIVGTTVFLTPTAQTQIASVAPGMTWPAGTPIRNTQEFSAGTISIEPLSTSQNTWSNRTAVFGGQAVTASDWAIGGKIPLGTAFIKLAVYGNWDTNGGAMPYIFDLSALSLT